MNILTYNLRFGGMKNGENYWARILDEFSPDIVLAQETNDPYSYFSSPSNFNSRKSVIWGKTSSGWGSAIYSKNDNVIPINVPDFEGWVVGGKIESFSLLPQNKPLYLFSVHTPSPGRYEKKSLSILDAIKAVADDSDLIIAGDFNITTAVRHPSETLKNSKLELEFINRLRREFGLTNSWQAINPNKDLPQTLRWSGNSEAPYHCDGIFIPLSWVRLIEKCSVINSAPWTEMSDHYPIILKLQA